MAASCLPGDLLVRHAWARRRRSAGIRGGLRVPERGGGLRRPALPSARASPSPVPGDQSMWTILPFLTWKRSVCGISIRFGGVTQSSRGRSVPR